MPLEIERRFLVSGNEWREHVVKRTSLVQAYLCTDPERVVRVRIADERAYLTIKGRTSGCSRPEFEYEIPTADARAMLDLAATAALEKVRHEVRFEDRTWCVDEFSGAHAGLVLAECEFASESEAAAATPPAWVSCEVTHDSRYANAVLAGLSRGV